MISILLLTIGITACKTVSYVPVVPALPDLSVSRPTRPYLQKNTDDSDLKIDVLRLMSYSREMEAYADYLEEYIDEMQNVFSRGVGAREQK